MTAEDARADIQARNQAETQVQAVQSQTDRQPGTVEEDAGQYMTKEEYEKRQAAIQEGLSQITDARADRKSVV